MPRPSYHGVPVRGPGSNCLRMRQRFMRKSRSLTIHIGTVTTKRCQYKIALEILPQKPLFAFTLHMEVIGGVFSVHSHPKIIQIGPVVRVLEQFSHMQSKHNRLLHTCALSVEID